MEGADRQLAQARSPGRAGEGVSANAKLLRDLARALGQAEPPANDDEPIIDEQAIRERARRAVERMKRERKQG